MLKFSKVKPRTFGKHLVLAVDELGQVGGLHGAGAQFQRGIRREMGVGVPPWFAARDGGSLEVEAQLGHSGGVSIYHIGQFLECPAGRGR